MFLDPPLDPLTPIDVALFATIAAGLPIYAFVEHWHEKRSEAKGRAQPPLTESYRNGMAMLWTLSALVVSTWLLAGRPLSVLGIAGDSGWPFLAACALALAGSAFYGAQILTLRRSAAARAQLAALLKNQARVRNVMPRTEAERRSFRWLALTAGITEEVLFRGFLIWVFAHWMHPWAAAACALALFTIVHIYQESAKALSGVMLTGAALSALVLFGGSLLPAMLVHFVVDLASGEMAWIARQETAAASKTAGISEA